MRRKTASTKTIGDFGAETDGIVLAQKQAFREERLSANLKAERRSSARLCTGPKLAVAEDAFCEQAVLQLIDQCIVPALVDLFLRDQLSLPDTPGRAHNVDQP